MSDQVQAFKSFIAKAADRQALSEGEAEKAFSVMMSGEATAAQIGGFLMALRVRGETVDEITGAARAMRARAVALDAPADAIDTCGTGGDSSGTFNVSTAAALVVAGCGVPVAKHGNRALSSRSGSADMLRALGVDIDADLSLVAESLRSAGIGFMMAPRHHSAMRHVGPARVELGTRTIFNLLGPLSNPAGTRRQLVGVFARDWVEPMARVLGKLGSERAWVVHGADGLDEVTTTGPTHVAALEDGRVRLFQVTPEDAGLGRAQPANLLGGDAEENAAALWSLLEGTPGAYRDIVVINSAAALIVAGRAKDLAQGARQAEESIDSGSARRALEAMITITNRGTAHD
jgi:anthranilate phosphoribosyltransferase